MRYTSNSPVGYQWYCIACNSMVFTEAIGKSGHVELRHYYQGYLARCYAYGQSDIEHFAPL